jgi:hypothetical protein
LIPDFAGSESKKIGRFIWGAHQDVRPNMRTAKPRTMQEATEMLAELTEEFIRTKGARGGEGGMKRKFEGSSSGKKFGKNFRGKKKFGRSGFKARKVEPKEDNMQPWCQKCRVEGHRTRECNKPITCFSCGQEGHVKADCPEPQGPLRTK